MATRTAPKSSSTPKSAGAAKRAAPKKRSTPRRAAGAKAADPFAGFAEAAQLKSMMTPEQAFELYRQNARLALDIIDAAIESTAKMRKLQFEGEEEARALHKRAARRAAEAASPQALVAAGQNAGQEGVQKALAYWTQMFDLVVEMQKRLFAVIEQQTTDVPGVKEARAALSLLPDFKQAQKLVDAMQGVLATGGDTFESIQRVMGDLGRMAQQAVPGMKR